MKRRNITDRAHRYRANSAEHRPLGPKVCAQKLRNGKRCGSRRHVVPHHEDGNPANTKRSNLSWACKSCNTRLGKEFARKGKGRRTRQYNPVYVQAAVDHTRGAIDAAGKVIHETPKGKRKAFAREIWNRRRLSGNPKKGRKNPGAEELYRKFHGRGPDKSYDVMVPVTDPYNAHPEIAQLGKLLSLTVGEDIELVGAAGTLPKGEGWARQIHFDSKQPDVAAEPGGTQIYFAGGDQNLDAMLADLGADPRKEILDLGFCYRIEYTTQKKFDQFRPTDYWHLFGEETGVQPRLLYDRVHKLITLAGGEYVIKPEGIVN
ncbi:MAG: hypothetical protein ACRD20_02305 [Terriglobales bacterium]